MAKEKRTLEIVAEVKDKASRAWRRISGTARRSLRRVQQRVEKVATAIRGVSRWLKRVALGFTALGAAAAGFAVVFLREFAKFEESLAKISTLVDTNVVNMDEYGETILRVGRLTGDTFDSLGKAAFDLQSATGDAELSMRSLEVAAKLGVAGVTDTATAVDALTSIMGAYGKQAGTALEISDALFTAQKSGKVEISEMAAVMGKMSGTAATVGLRMKELLAAFSALTISVKPEEAATALNALLSSIIKPTEAGRVVVDRMKAAIRGEGGLVDAVKVLQDAFEEYGDDVGKLFESQRQLRGLFALLADDASNFKRAMVDMQDSVGATDEAYQKMAGTLSRQFQRFLRTVQVLFIRIGEALAPLVEGKLQRFTDFVEGLVNKREQIREITRTLTGTVSRFVEVIKTAVGEGQGFDLLVRSGREAMRALAKVLVDAIPIVARAAILVGKNMALSIVDGFNQSIRTLVLAGASGGVGAKLVRELLPEDLARKSRQIRDLNNEIKHLQSTINIGRQRARGAPKGFLPFGVRQAEARLKQATKERFALIAGLSGGARDVLKKEEAQLRRDVAALGGTAVEAMRDAVRNVREGSSTEVQGAIDKLLAFVRGAADRMRAAAAKDAAAAAKDTGAAINKATADAAEKARAGQEAADKLAAQRRAQLARELSERLAVFDRTDLEQRIHVLREKLDAEKAAVQARFGHEVALRAQTNQLLLALEHDFAARVAELRQKANADAEVARLEHAKKQLEANGSMLDGFRHQLDEYDKEQRQAFKNGRQLADDLSRALSNSLGNALADIFTGVRTIEQAFGDMARAVLRHLANMIAQTIAWEITLRALRLLIGGAAGGGSSSSAESTAPGTVGDYVRGGGGVNNGLAGGRGGGFIPPVGGGNGPLPASNGPSGGDTIHVNFNITAWDGQSVRKTLVDESETIEGIMTRAVAQGRRRGLRNAIAGVRRQ